MIYFEIIIIVFIIVFSIVLISNWENDKGVKINPQPIYVIEQIV